MGEYLKIKYACNHFTEFWKDDLDKFIEILLDHDCGNCYQEDIDEFDGDVRDLQDALIDSDETIDNLNYEIDELKEEIDELKERIEFLEEE